MKAKSLIMNCDSFDHFMTGENFKSTSNINICTVIRMCISKDMLEDTLLKISHETAQCYLSAITGRIQYDYDTENEWLSIFIWGSPTFVLKVISSITRLNGFN